MYKSDHATIMADYVPTSRIYKIIEQSLTDLQHIATKAEFSSKDWNELKKIFKSAVQWKSFKTPEEFQMDFDENCTLPNLPTNELEKFYIAVQYISSVMYPIRKEAITEGHYSSAYIFPLLVYVLTDNDSFKIEWYKADVKIVLKKPAYQYQILLREILDGIEDSKFIKEYKNEDGQDLIKLLVYGVQVIGAHINIYSIIWHGGSVYLFGLVDICILPMTSSFIMEIERFISKKRCSTMTNNVAVKEVLVCLQHKISITEDGEQLNSHSN
ncbi:22596_t:CDS:2 [Gigaspora margarita]|uniref:22596_t:CDS:1 n=1 Tax=Gigaspora margarita TaxID=4874 RepID=A0ABN7UYU7_GIGMA|nr:22596_t:CDS:2 [Gigaspora margarita]